MTELAVRYARNGDVHWVVDWSATMSLPSSTSWLTRGCAALTTLGANGP